jgi:glycosyltransferase involved in cell wall biosynthesis
MTRTMSTNTVGAVPSSVGGRRPPSLLMVATTHLTVRSFLLPFARHFRTLGWRVDAAAQGIADCPDCQSACDRVWDLNWSRNPLSPANLTEGRARIGALASSVGYDLVHVHTPVAAFVTRLALRRHRRAKRLKVIYTAHGFHFYQGGPTLRNWAFMGLERLAGQWTDELVVINREDEAAADRLGIVAPEHIHYMPGIGVDLAQYAAESVSPADVARVRSELGLAADNPLYLMIAGFDPGKRHRDLLAAFAKLPNRRSHLAFAGMGPMQPAIASMAEKLGLTDRVHFLGFRRDIPALIRASVATALPSEREGLPRSVMESMCLDVPVVGTRIRGLGDLLGDGCGLLHAVGDVEQLAAHLQAVVDQPAEARAMVERAKRRIAHYDLTRVIELHERLYSRVLEGAGHVVSAG